MHLHSCAISGDMSGLRRVLDKHPSLVNSEILSTPVLNRACCHGHVEIVRYLLTLPKIKPNKRGEHGSTGFMLACWEGRTSVVELLLADPRIDVNIADNKGRTPLWVAISGGHVQIVWHIVGSQRQIDLSPRCCHIDGNDYTARGLALRIDLRDVAAVIQLCEQGHRGRARYITKKRLGLLHELAAEFFALAVFISDDLLRIWDDYTGAGRFLKIAGALPMELQMLLCHKVVRSQGKFVSTTHAEAAFRALACCYEK
jgi:hypothetical protein